MAHMNTIPAEDRQAILDAARKLFYVQEDEANPGHYSIELDADYRDDNEFLLETAYEHRDDAEDILIPLVAEITEAWQESIWDAESSILREAGFDPFSDATEPQLQWLRDNISIEPPLDHYLDQDMKVNILLTTPLDRKEDDSMPFMIRDSLMFFTGAGELTRDLEANIHSESEAQHILQQDSMIKRLVEQQGFTMEDLSTVARDYFYDFYGVAGQPRSFPYRDENGKELSYDKRFDLFIEKHNKFLSTVCQELDNISYTFGCVTVLAKLSMKDYAKMLQQGSEITMPKGCSIGLFAPWNGSGSVLGIELEKDFIFKRGDIYDVQIEGAKPAYGYTADQTFGLVDSAWFRPCSIKEKETPLRKPGLDQQIQNANRKTSHGAGENTPAVEPER